jgi:hypothetical protein
MECSSQFRENERGLSMPIMQVYYRQAALDTKRKFALGQKLTDILIAMEGGAGT